jgi:branched-chain amino acid transport system substrate-binding protein
MSIISRIFQFASVAFICAAIFNPLQVKSENKGAFNVGVIIPLSGDLADYGVSIRRGFNLAVEQSPERFANIHFVFEDSRYDAKTAVSALQKLRTTNNVDLYYAWGVSPTEAIVPITEANRLPLLVETTLKESTTNKLYVVRAARTGERIAKSLVEQLSRTKAKRVSLIVADIPFYDDIINHLKSILPTRGIEITRIRSILPSENDVRAYLPELSKQKEDAIGVFLLPAQIVSYFKRAAEMKVKLPAFSADIIGSDSIIKDCPDNVNGTFFTEVGVTSEFRRLYNAKFKDDGHIGHGAQAFDVANIIADLFGRLDRKVTADDIMLAISHIPPQKGATGEFRFSDTPDSGKELRMPVAMKMIRDKKIETILEDTGF